MSGARAGASSLAVRWRRWGKYPPHHLLVGAAYRAWRAVRDRWVPFRTTPELGLSPADDLAPALCGRLGIPVPPPGGGIPTHAPFGGLVPDGVLDAAEDALHHRFDLLGSGPVEYGPIIDWHRDAKSGARWAAIPAHRLRAAIAPGADVRMPWELGRFHHATPLLQAYLLNGDERWAVELRVQVAAFQRANPPGHGVQWLSAMDVAIRAAMWSWMLAVLASGPHLPRDEADAWLTSLRQHGRWIRGHLSWNPHSRGNHYLSELVGLLHVGLVLGDTGEGRQWARFAARRIRREMRHQVRDDGVDGEASTNYHRLVTELFAQAAVLMRSTSVTLDLEPDPGFDRRLEAMLEAVAGWTRPDGTAPLLGDVDDGRLLAFAAPPDPRRHHDSLRPYAVPSVATVSRAWPQGGMFALRGEDALVVVRCGPVGLYGRGAHDHADQLAVDVTLAGAPVFVDPGTYLYTSDREARHAFRSTRAHNTVMLDDRDQMTFTPLSLFEVENGATGVVTAWESTKTGTEFEGRHDGYRARGVTHARRIELPRHGRRVRVVDMVSGSGEHAVRIAWQLDPAVRVEHIDDDSHALTLLGDSARYRLQVTEPGPLRWGREDGWVAPRYGVRLPAPRLVLSGRVTAPARWEFEVTVL